MNRTIPLCILAALLVVAPQASAIDLAGATIVVEADASPLEVFAAREISRYFRLLSGQPSPVTASTEEAPGPLVRLARDPDLGEQEYALRAAATAVSIHGGSRVAVQYGAYSLLEKLGVGFYLGGDALPSPRESLLVPDDLDERRAPVFSVRGSLPWYNFLNSPTTWDLEDYRFFFNQMAKQKMNFVGFHSYDHEPFCAYPWEGAWRMGAPAATSLTYGWGTIRHLGTEDFGFGTGSLFPDAVFGSRSATQATQPPDDITPSDVIPLATETDDAIIRAQCVLAQGLQYAHDRGVRTCLGFELHGDPTDAALRLQTEARIRHMLATYPMLDYVWFWQPEGMGGGSQPPAPDTPLDLIIQRHRPAFEYLGNDNRIAEAARVAAWVGVANSIVKRLRPNLRVIVSGWGGDRWMRFSDFYVGLDKVLPEDIIFAALDNIDPAWERNVSAAYGQLSPGREKWPIPWFESDGGGTRRDQWGPQANVEPFTALLRDAQAKGCDGLLGIHWQTRGIEEVMAYTAQFAWDPELTYEGFYGDFARKSFGETNAEQMADVLMRLESLGPRWTGALGQVECGRFAWFSSPDRPEEEKLNTLRETLAALEDVDTESWSQGERLRYLQATIRFLLAYDEAALVLQPDGPADRLIGQAEEAVGAGDKPEARRLARAALGLMREAPLREAMEAYADRLTTQGDFGNLATINVKAYATYRELWERGEAALGEPQFERAPEPRRRLVVNHPPTALPEGTRLTLRVVAPGTRQGETHTLAYRKPGDQWSFAEFRHSGRDLYTCTLPARVVGPEGVEVHVVGYNSPASPGGELPKPSDFFPSAPLAEFSSNSWTISTMPTSGPAIYGPHLHRNMALAPWTASADEPATLRCTVIPREEYGAAKVELTLDDSTLSASARYHTALFPLAEGLLEHEALRAVALGRDAQGRTATGALVGFTRPSAPQAPRDLQAEVVGPLHARVTGEATPCRHYEVHRSADAAFEPAAETLLGEWPWSTYDDVTVQPNTDYAYAVVAVDDLGQRSAVARTGLVHVGDFPPLPAPEGVTATPGIGRVTVGWQPVTGPVRGYAVFLEDGGEWTRVSGEQLVLGTQFVAGGLAGGVDRRLQVRAGDRAGRLGEASAPVTCVPLQAPREPIFATGFDSLDAETGQTGKLVGKAKLDGGALDTREGGYISFPREELLQASGPLTVELWVNIDRVEGIPVMVSFGHWEGPGYWLQLIGGNIRWYLSTQKIVDGGGLPAGDWHHICGTYDGVRSRLYVDGEQVGEREVGVLDMAPWAGELRVGMYSDVEGQFQTLGRLDDVRIYQRALSAEEVKQSHAEGRSE